MDTVEVSTSVESPTVTKAERTLMDPETSQLIVQSLVVTSVDPEMIPVDPNKPQVGVHSPEMMPAEVSVYFSGGSSSNHSRCIYFSEGSKSGYRRDVYFSGESDSNQNRKDSSGS